MDADQIRQRQFSRCFRGYDPSEVNAYLGQVAERLGELVTQNGGFEREIERLQQDLKSYRTREQSLEAALSQTRKVSEEIKANAEREAQLLVAEAELQAEKLLGQAHGRLAQIHDDIAELKRQRAQFEVRLRALVEAHLKIIDVERDRDRELSELEDKIKILRTPGS
jgi:cell division initiation protein